jgi:hypothetical protein
MTIIAAIVRTVTCCKETAGARRRVAGIVMCSRETASCFAELSPIDDNFETSRFGTLR